MPDAYGGKAFRRLTTGMRILSDGKDMQRE